MQIKDKVFIVTGGASGLGEGTARLLAASGGKVVIADMNAERGQAVAREIGATSPAKPMARPRSSRRRPWAS